MSADRQRLDNQQIAELQQFIEGVDRGRAEIFVGREVELEMVASRLRTVDRRKDERRPGGDLTLVFQGAPGAGKSALLAKLASDLPASRQEGPVALELNTGSLRWPEHRLKSEIAAALAASRPLTFGQWRKLVATARIGAGNTYLDVQLDGAKAEERKLKEALAKSPVVLLFDEIQATAIDAMGEGCTNFKGNLRWLHAGEHGLSMFPVFGGLANSGDMLRSAGLTRLSSKSEFTLARFSSSTSNELMARFVSRYLSSAVPPAEIVERWRSALLRDSQGWPMHCRNFLCALAEQVRDCDWRPEGIDLDQVRLTATTLRDRYYGHRLAGPLTERQGLVSVVLEQLKRTGPLAREAIVDRIRDADERARRNPDLEGDHRWTVPAETGFRQIFEAMQHSGIVQHSSLENGFECPIPSLGSYMAARAALPSERLHGAVMRGSVAALESATDRCPGPQERSELFNAWDKRGRTPLILAIEAGLYPLVRRIVELELALPEDLRSFGREDIGGRRACDHAAASDDLRIRALAETTLPPVATPTEQSRNA